MSVDSEKPEIANYEIIRRLGQGQFGTVAEVVDKRDKQTYALKCIRILKRDIELQEAEALAKVARHQNIVQYFHTWIGESPSDDVFKHDEKDEDYRSEEAGSLESGVADLSLQKYCIFIKTELCDMTLRQWKDNFPDSLKNIRNVLGNFFQIAVALKFIHLSQNKLIHRDLKPENIFLKKYGQNGWTFKIGDFGSVFLGIVQSTPNYIYGTSPYIAPELENRRNYDEKVDVYALGIIFMELVFQTKTLMELMELIEQLKSNSWDGPNKCIADSHKSEIQQIQKMTMADPQPRCTSKSFHIWLKNYRKSSIPKCSCHPIKL